LLVADILPSPSGVIAGGGARSRADGKASRRDQFRQQLLAQKGPGGEPRGISSSLAVWKNWPGASALTRQLRAL